MTLEQGWLQMLAGCQALSSRVYCSAFCERKNSGQNFVSCAASLSLVARSCDLSPFPFSSVSFLGGNRDSLNLPAKTVEFCVVPLIRCRYSAVGVPLDAVPRSHAAIALSPLQSCSSCTPHQLPRQGSTYPGTQDPQCSSAARHPGLTTSA